MGLFAMKASPGAKGAKILSTGRLRGNSILLYRSKSQTSNGGIHMSERPVRLDATRRAIVRGGETHRLQERTWRVAKLLADKHPETVSRDEFIDTIWNGNAPVGDKGLNQAIWQLRRALSDSPREPQVIRTIPRVGYRWLEPPPDPDSAPSRTSHVGKLLGMAGVLAAALGAVLVSQNPGASASIGTAENPATDAYLVGRDVHLVFKDGTAGKLINARNADIHAPLLSRDGTELAIAVMENGQCRMLTLNIATQERVDYGKCPGV